MSTLAVYDKTYQGNKWGGKYLRAPDIYWHILEKCKDKLVPLSSVADVRFGIKTGCNKFFYLKKEDVEKWGIEGEFLLPVLKTAKDSQMLLIEKSALSTYILYCNNKMIEFGRRKIDTRLLLYNTIFTHESVYRKRFMLNLCLN